MLGSSVSWPPGLPGNNLLEISSELLSLNPPSSRRFASFGNRKMAGRLKVEIVYDAVQFDEP